VSIPGKSIGARNPANRVSDWRQRLADLGFRVARTMQLWSARHHRRQELAKMHPSNRGPTYLRWAESTKQHLVHLLPMRVPLLPRPFPDFVRDQIGCYARILQIAVRHNRQFMAAMMSSRPQLHGQCGAKAEISSRWRQLPTLPARFLFQTIFAIVDRRHHKFSDS
jgi:hypothetical protein